MPSPQPDETMRTVSAEVADDRELLDLMMRASQRQHRLWKPTAYWQTYCRRILGELEARGLREFRTNQAILKGFAFGGEPRPAMPRAAWKRVLWRGAAHLPAVRTILAEHAHILRAEHKQTVTANVRLAKVLIAGLAADFPDLNPPSGLANGGAEDAFEWRGHTLTAEWVLHAVRAAAFYQVVPPSAVRRMIEIGPGLGLSNLAHVALNRGLRTIINVDIPPVLYVSTQFLKSIDDLTVTDMRSVDHDGPILTTENAESKVRVLQLAPWQLPRVEGTVDLFCNAYSFQEMEPDVCGNYADVLAPMVTGSVFLLSSVHGHEPGAGGQRQPVTLDFLEGLFASAFPVKRTIEDPRLALLHDPREALLMSRPEG